VHLSCLLKVFKSAGGEQLKNKLDWLREFIKQAHLYYICSNCSSNKPTMADTITATQLNHSSLQLHSDQDIINMKQSISDMAIKISDVLSNMNALRSELISKLAVFVDGTTATTDPSNCANPNQSSAGTDKPSCRPPSYASILSKDISEVVKSTVAESLKSQQRLDKEKSAVVVYGLPEKSDDLKSAQDVLAAIGYTGMIVKAFRIGKQKATSASTAFHTGTSAVRPLKLELYGPTECKYLLSRASLLRNIQPFKHIRINQWLSRAELDSLKELRDKCRKLNSESSFSSADGKSPYVVISGRLMKRATDGKLCPAGKDVTITADVKSANTTAPAHEHTQARASYPKNE
jgi:hypothetical protein